MSQRGMVVGGAVGVAALVLGASLFLGPPAGTGDRVGDDGAGIGAAIPSGLPGENGGLPGYRAEGGGYQVIEAVGENKTRITVLRAANTSTRGRGITHFVRPVFQIVTTEDAWVPTGTDERGNPTYQRRTVAGRAMVLTADRAEMEMDGEVPQRGVFQGNVRVTLLEAEGHPPILDEDDPRYGENSAVQRIFIDGDARFGLDTNEVRSDAPVHVTSAQADFYGIGLLLKYNTARERIEQLVINEGRYLMFNPDAEQRAALDAEVTTNDETTPPDNANASNNAQAQAGGDINDQDDPDAPPPGPSQFYLATFSNNIIVRDTDRALLEGETLRVRFSLGTEAVEPDNAPGITPPETPATDTPAPGEDATGRATRHRLHPLADQRYHEPRTVLAPALPGMRLAFAGDNALPTDLENAEPNPDDHAPTDPQPSFIDPFPPLPAPPPPLDPMLVPAKNQQRSLYTAAPEDGIVITWTGPLHLTPLHEKPDELEDEKDLAIAIAGPNAYAQSMRDGSVSRVEAVELSYLVAAEAVTAVSGEDRPLAILSQGAGTLTAPPGARLTVDIKNGTATILGPGTLTQSPDDEGKQLVLAWTDRLDLDLYTQQPDDNPVDPAEADRAMEDRYSAGGQTRIVGIRTATFRGGVTASHPDFDMTGDRLAIDFTEPDEGAGINARGWRAFEVARNRPIRESMTPRLAQKNDPTRINATGDVAVFARGDDADEAFEISTQSLRVTMARDTDGKPYAESMRAVAQVRIARPGSVLTCHRVDVAFAPPSESEPAVVITHGADPAIAAVARAIEYAAAPEPKPDEPRYAQVRSLVAVGDVRAQLDYDGRKINLVADHLLGDVAADRLTLYATEEGSLAEVVDVREDRLLRGRHIVMDDQAEVVRVEGAGALSARMEDPEMPGNPQANMTIDWDRAMRFNNLTGKAEFHGQVEAASRRTADTTDLSCDDLVVWFTQPVEVPPAVAQALEEDAARQDAGDGADPAGNNGAQADAEDGGPVEGDEADDDLALDAGGRDIRRAVATGNVRFVAATRAAQAPDKPHARVRIVGPELVFTNEPLDIDGTTTPVESVVVTGRGSMFIEDYTPEEDERPELDNERPDAIAFSGKGQTAFFWEDRMTLDALANTATFDGGVEMLHDPTPDDRANDDFMHMRCAQLIADMQDTGGLGVWMSDDAPAPEISVVTAQGPLTITQAGKEIQGDHLRYTAAALWAEVWADPDRDVVLTEQGRPAPARAGRVVWDLANNRIEMRDARGGAVPAER